MCRSDLSCRCRRCADRVISSPTATWLRTLWQYVWRRPSGCSILMPTPQVLQSAVGSERPHPVCHQLLVQVVTRATRSPVIA